MHIPPGFLKPEVWIPMYGLSVAAVGYALKKSGEEIDDTRMPVMGVVASFIFAAQMVNFPVAGGTSGHLMGSALAVAILGMWPGMLAMTAVVLMQALLFQDGGLDALGANIFNMAVLGCLVSGAVIGVGRRFGERALYLSTALAGWLTITAAAFLCAVELAVSKTSPFSVVVPAMTGIHAVIGVVEGFISVAALKFIAAVKPGLIRIQTGVEL